MSNEPLERAICPLCGRLVVIFTPTDREGEVVFCGHRIAHAKNGIEGTPWCQGGGRRVGENVTAQTPPYIDPSDRGSYDTDELDALEAAAAEPPAEVVTDDAA